MSESAGSLREVDARPPDAAYKRQLAHDMREARHHLAAATGIARPLELDLTRAYAKNVVRAWPYYGLLALAIISAATLWQPPGALLPGALLVVAMTTAVGIACHRFCRLVEPGSSLRAWRAAFVIAEFALGAAWLALLLPLLTPSPEPHAAPGSTFVLFAALIVMGTAAIFRVPVPAAVHAGMVPLALVVLFIAFQGRSREDVAFALLVLSAQLFVLYFVHRLHQAAAANARSRAELRASFAELEQIKANTSHARQRAEEAERAKAQFLATVSHELRTPLNAILGFSEVMKNEVLGSHSTPSYREYSSDIHGSGQQLLALINEILELSRIESGRYELNEEWLRLGDIVGAAADLMAEQADAKGQTITSAVDPELTGLWADPRAVRQIVLNLLSNAVKFTPAGGHIAVKAGWTSRGGQYISIADDGPGIPEEEIPIALSSFGRGSLAVSMAANGAGLGLPIAKGLADLLGGRLVLRSKPRAGTEAVVVFPASRAEAARPSSAPRSAAAAA